jgi:4-amino-4-deoxychorismate lyase
VESGVDPRDRGLQYGDGVFRTLRVVAGRPRWWRAQLAKLEEDCRRLRIDCPPESLWRADLAALGRIGDGVLKLLVTRGDGPRGYRPPQGALPRRILIYRAGLPPAWDTANGIVARVCDLRLGRQPLLAGIKHLARLENVLASAEWAAPEIAEGLLLDDEERVISGVMSNLLIWRGARLTTPRLHRCGVAGVTRALLMRLARADGIEVCEDDMTLDEVLSADELMLCNSVMGLARVARLGERTWPAPIISTHLAAALESLDNA